MPRPVDPNSRTIAVTIKVNREEEAKLRRLGGTPGKGLRQALNRYWQTSLLRSEK